AFAFFPVLARLVQIELSNPDFVPIERFQQLLAGTGARLPDLLVTVALGNGFILTSMLWGAFVAKLIDRNLKTASLYLLICAAFAFFCIIHSALPGGNTDRPCCLPVPD